MKIKEKTLTALIPTKNNGHEITNAIESMKWLDFIDIVVGDMASTDDTVKVAEELGVRVVALGPGRRDLALNRLAAEAKTPHKLLVYPWEGLMQGHNPLYHYKGEVGYVRIFQDSTFTWEPRFWKGDRKFVNPVHEQLDVEDGEHLGTVFFSKGRSDFDDPDYFKGLATWKEENPLSARPYYYHACALLSQAKYDDFLAMADHYLFLDKTSSISAVMLRYYYAMVQITQKRAFKPALQNLNLCLCANPLMAEFWCLTGDVYYHLLHRFDQAKVFYDNAMILGAKRLFKERWPMDITKYREYPAKMIASCDELIAGKSFFGKL